MHWRRKRKPTPVFLPGESQRRGSLVGCRLWGRTESDTTEQLHFHFSLSCIGEGNGNPLQYFCLENPSDGAAWWAAVYGVAQTRTRLKRRSSSSCRNVSVFVNVLFSFLRQIVSDTFDRSPPGSSGRGSSQAGILAWVAISFSRGSSRHRDRTHISCIGRRILYH